MQLRGQLWLWKEHKTKVLIGFEMYQSSEFLKELAAFRRGCHSVDSPPRYGLAQAGYAVVLGPALMAANKSLDPDNENPGHHNESCLLRSGIQSRRSSQNIWSFPLRTGLENRASLPATPESHPTWGDNRRTGRSGVRRPTRRTYA